MGSLGDFLLKIDRKLTQSRESYVRGLKQWSAKGKRSWSGDAAKEINLQMMEKQYKKQISSVLPRTHSGKADYRNVAKALRTQRWRQGKKIK